jgi:hypothetical protein
MTWQTERPLRPPAGIDLVDKIALAFDERERMQAAAPDVMRAMMQMLTTQSQQIAALAALVMREDKTKPRRKTKA